MATKKQTTPKIPAGKKRCSRCGKVKPMEHFASNRAAKDGRYSQCRACEAEVRQEVKARKAAEQAAKPRRSRKAAQ